MQLKIAIINFFSQDDIAEARQVMIDNVRDVIPEYPHLNKKRTDSVNRAAVDIMVDDMLEMFKLLDTADQQWLVPTFVCDNVCKLPSSPEAAGNVMSLYEEIAAHEGRLIKLQETMTQVLKDISSNKTEIASLKQRSPPGGKGNHTNRPNGDSRETPRRMPRLERQPILEQQAPASAAATADSEVLSDNENTASTSDTQVGESNTNHYRDAVLNDKSSPTENDTFKTVGPNSGKRPNKGANPKTKRPQRTGGTCEELGCLLAGPETFQLQLTNLSPTLGTDDISNYVENKGDDINVLKVEDITSECWNTKRFLVTLEYKYLNTVLSGEFWPKNVYFKRWFTHKKSNNAK